MLRRLASLAMVLLTLNVSAAEALRACAKQERQTTQQHKGCEKPETPATQQPAQCCAAMASCMTTIEIDGAADEARVTPDREGMIPRAASRPSAIARTPEPPPPKGLA